jgi:AbrB family looped-hinge helix DNA binding protein
MTTTIDAAGRVVLPKALREEARLSPGVPVEIRCRDGIIEIEPAPLPVSLTRRGRLIVATPDARVPVLTTTAVEATRQRLRKDRGTE